MTKFVSTWIVVILCASSHAQDRGESAVTVMDARTAREAFDVVVPLHRESRRNLIGTRGIRRVEPPEGHFDRQTVLAALRNDGYLLARYAANTGVLFYAHSAQGLTTWLIAEDGVRIGTRREVTATRIDELVDNLRLSLGIERASRAKGIKLLPHSNVLEAKKKRMTAATRALSEVLVPAEIARRMDDLKHVIVVPTLAIGTVPFALLQPFESDEFLIERMTISIASSLLDLNRHFDSWEFREGNALVVGNPKFAESSEFELAPLPGAEREARSVASRLRVDPLIGAVATESAVRKSKAYVLHLATHGHATASNAVDGSFIALAPDDESDGFWTAREIQDGSLHGTGLAVLSACQTGLGQTHAAGVIGLARAFQLAGVPRVVISLWNVNDTATEALMTTFTHNLRTSVPAVALRDAILSYKDRDPNPRHWAPFTLFGTPR